MVFEISTFLYFKHQELQNSKYKVYQLESQKNRLFKYPSKNMLLKNRLFLLFSRHCCSKIGRYSDPSRGSQAAKGLRKNRIPGLNRSKETSQSIWILNTLNDKQIWHFVNNNCLFTFLHCVKSVHIRSYSGLHFPHFV